MRARLDPPFRTLGCIDSLWFSVLFFGYHLALALIVGGGIVLGAAAAPALFKVLPRAEAGTAFGAVLARYDQLAIVSVIVVVLTAYLRAANYETPDLTHWIRWSALAVMSLAVVYASAWASPVARTLRAQTRGFDDLPETTPARLEFARLHARSRRAMSVAIVAGLVALFLS